jgi:hypothetical protein
MDKTMWPLEGNVSKATAKDAKSAKEGIGTADEGG